MKKVPKKTPSPPAYVHQVAQVIYDGLLHAKVCDHVITYSTASGKKVLHVFNDKQEVKITVEEVIV